MRRSLILILAGAALCSCTALQPRAGSYPNKYEIETGNLIIRSDLKIRASHPLLADLKTIQHELRTLLELPPSSRPVVVHLFSDEERYRAFMQARHPNLPARRAFFIGSPSELGVYAHWSENVGEDLRHEYTHGVLHSCLKNVPLWLDEGLAEYFEVERPDARRRHPEHTTQLALALQRGWRPDLARLETINDVAQMRRADYQEAWAWVHYLVHDAPDGREALVDYCRLLRKSDPPPRLSERIHRLVPDAETRLASYISLSLSDGVELAGGDRRSAYPPLSDDGRPGRATLGTK